MATRDDLLKAVADLRAAADMLEGANDAAMLHDVDVLIATAAIRVKGLRA
jgi:hypothetical protein